MFLLKIALAYEFVEGLDFTRLVLAKVKFFAYIILSWHSEKVRSLLAREKEIILIALLV